MKRSVIVQSNASVTVPAGTLVVVSGGTQGIGEAVAYRFAEAGAAVWIIGRNEMKANDVLLRLREISEEQRVDPPPEHHFMKADLSLIAEAKRIAREIRVRGGTRGIDYLVMSQGGQPNGTFAPTSEGYDTHYAVQVLSRCLLAYLLGSNPAGMVPNLRGVMSIMSPGYTPHTTDYDDFELQSARTRGMYGIRAMYARDSNVVDAFTAELAARNPRVSFTHIFPGLVNTNIVDNSRNPFFFGVVMKLVLALFGSTPASYAEVPFYLLANPEGCKSAAEHRYWDSNASRLEPHPSSQEEVNKGKVWAHIMEVLESSK
ncbi:NAD(P)-binding protein [Ramaria rubella]|nr:NAD(P)-binding protein [Ramaria rubella]